MEAGGKERERKKRDSMLDFFSANEGRREERDSALGREEKKPNYPVFSARGIPLLPPSFYSAVIQDLFFRILFLNNAFFVRA